MFSSLCLSISQVSWSEWGAWDSCGISDCGKTKFRRRECYYDPTQDEAGECDGDIVEYWGCDIGSCKSKGTLIHYS